MRKAHVKEGEEDGAEDDKKEEVPTEREVVCNCMAFLATTFIAIGELLNEQNLWAVMVVGGGLSAINVMFTAAGLDAIANAGGEGLLPTRVALASGQDIRKVAGEVGENGAVGIEPRRQRNQHRGKEGRGERGEGHARRERPKRDRDKREDGKKRKSTRKKDRLERREKRDRRTRRKRRDEESGLHTVVQV